MSERGQKFLVTNGALSKRTHQQQQIIGCLACRWKATEALDSDPRAYARQIATCLGLESGTVVPILKRIERGGAVAGTREYGETLAGRRSPRMHYRPTNSELGEGFRASLEVPGVCGLESGNSGVKSDARKAAKIAKRAGIEVTDKDTLISGIIQNSSRGQLEAIIEQATRQIEQLDNQSSLSKHSGRSTG